MLYIPRGFAWQPCRCALRREIWAVYNSLLPAVYWAQTFTSALLLVYQANALAGLFYVLWAHEQLAKLSHIPITPMCCRGWNHAEMFIFLTSCKTWHSPAFWGLSRTSQLQVARGQITTASVQTFVFIPIPKKPTNNSPLGFPWNEAQYSQGSEKKKKS